MQLQRTIRGGVAALASCCLMWGAAKEKDTKRAVMPGAGVKTPGVRIPFASLKPEAELPAEGAISALIVADSVFIADVPSNSILRFDAKANKPGEPIKGLSKPCGGLVNAFGSLWSPNCGDQTIARIDPKSGKITATIPIGVGSASPAIVADSTSIWLLADDKTTLIRIDPTGNAIVAEVRLPSACNSIAFGEGSLWVTCPKEGKAGKVLRIDPKTNLVDKRIETAAQPISVAFGEGSAWILCKTEGKISKVDPKTNKVSATIDLSLPEAGGNVAFSDGSIWVTSTGFPITRIDPQTDKVAQQFWGEGNGLLQTGLGSIWLANVGKGSILRLDPKRIVATLAE